MNGTFHFFYSILSLVTVRSRKSLIASSRDETEYTDIDERYRITDRVRCRTCTRLKESMAIEFLLRLNVTLRHLLMRYYYQFYFSS